ARLIHLAAAYGVSAEGKVVVIDIGGGSVEITKGSGSTMDVGRSFKLGVIRLTERFVKNDPLEPRDERKLLKYIDVQAGGYLDQLARSGFDRVIGTSGTILSFGGVVGAGQGGGACPRRVIAQPPGVVEAVAPGPQTACVVDARTAAPSAWPRSETS